ncbi:Zn-dependent hydrolase [Williamsia sp. MIQD14]|uniref:Zn-dependent hydrolase n=1 Tax=Williamsia sp. MIQD14 TaxID=3425703 RepID=UPI003DA048C7
MADPIHLARARRVMRRCDVLARDSARPDAIHRLFLTPEHDRANRRVDRWMREAGLTTWRDRLGSQWGQTGSAAPTTERPIVIGSHLDTVPDAGRYDGVLGVLLGIEVAEVMAPLRAMMRHPLRVVAFGDEEGARFPATLMTSRFAAGSVDPAWADLRDRDGVTLADAMVGFGLDPDALADAPSGVDAAFYLEPHIEQDRCLERDAQPLGVVSGIAGAVRMTVTLHGAPAHAASAIADRRDAGSGAAEAVLRLEEYAHEHRELRITIGRMTFGQGTVNVVPGTAEFTVDVRATDDRRLARAVADVVGIVNAVAARRALTPVAATDHHAKATTFGGHVTRRLGDAIEASTATDTPHLWSIPGHDAMVFAENTDTGMVFIRSEGGHSHNPLERVAVEDVAAALKVCVDTVFALGAASSVRMAS